MIDHQFEANLAAGWYKTQHLGKTKVVEVNQINPTRGKIFYFTCAAAWQPGYFETAKFSHFLPFIKAH